MVYSLPCHLVTMATYVYKQSKMYNKRVATDKQAKNSSKHGINTTRTAAPRKVLASKSFQSNNNDVKSLSTGIIDKGRTSIAVPSARPKKTAKSDFIINKSKNDLDFCKKCGDALSKTSSQKSDSKSTSSTKNTGVDPAKSIVNNGRTKSVNQYYKNENFRISSESMQEVENGFKKKSLDTIKELPERRSSEVFKAKTETSDVFESPNEELGLFDTEDLDTVKKLKAFRDQNYFECHSAKSRIDNKVSAISLKDHKCTYRFYLNDRLFPVPVSTDHQDNIRCVECHLPLNLNNSDDGLKANGFIQAKIRIGEEDPQDTVMYLPVKDQLIIRERKKDEKREDEVVYFGVIKLDQTGNSVFNQNLPANSLALKYQKGYKEYHRQEEYRLQSIDKSDVVVI